MDEAKNLKKELKKARAERDQTFRENLDLATRNRKANKQGEELTHQLAQIESRCQSHKIAELEAELDATRAESTSRDAELAKLKAELSIAEQALAASSATLSEPDPSIGQIEESEVKYDLSEEYRAPFHKTLSQLEEEAVSLNNEDKERLNQFHCKMVERLLNRINKEILCNASPDRNSSIAAHCEEALSHLSEVGVQFRDMETGRGNA